MAGERRSFKREGEAARRESLIAAALQLIAEGGSEAATVRAIAVKAGVTPGLIRHYFVSKDDLTGAAYLSLMEGMVTKGLLAVDSAPDTPAARLATFIAASLRPPIMDATALGLWAGFLHRVRRDPAMAAVHEAGYMKYRDQLQSLIAALSLTTDKAVLRQQAIACNGVIDGLWLEGGALPRAFAPDELAEIGVRSVAAILGTDLPFPGPHSGDAT